MKDIQINSNRGDKMKNTNIKMIVIGAVFLLLGTIFVGGITPQNNWNLRDYFNITNVANLYLSGKVGIGTTTPTVELEVKGGVNISGGLNVTAGDVLLATESGRVGIGTASPAYKLDVIGDVNASNYYINGSSIFEILDNGTVNRSIDLGDYQLKAENTSLWNRSGNDIFNGDFDGNVGIGTSSPAEKLHVIGNVNVSGMIEANTINATERFVANNTLFVNNSMVGIGIDSPTHMLHVVGDANITGNLYLGKNLTDLAEYIFSEGDVEPADVVVVSDDMKVKKSYKPYDKKAIGVISTEPAAVFGGGKGDVELAISGRVPVKATNENGAIEPGDLLTTSSTPGHAMKCTSIGKCFGNVIGKALTRLEEEKGTVIMIVMLN